MTRAFPQALRSIAMNCQRSVFIKLYKYKPDLGHNWVPTGCRAWVCYVCTERLLWLGLLQSPLKLSKKGIVSRVSAADHHCRSLDLGWRVALYFVRVCSCHAALQVLFSSLWGFSSLLVLLLWVVSYQSAGPFLCLLFFMDRCLTVRWYGFALLLRTSLSLLHVFKFKVFGAIFRARLQHPLVPLHYRVLLRGRSMHMRYSWAGPFPDACSLFGVWLMVS